MHCDLVGYFCFDLTHSIYNDPGLRGSESSAPVEQRRRNSGLRVVGDVISLIVPRGTRRNFEGRGEACITTLVRIDRVAGDIAGCLD